MLAADDLLLWALLALPLAGAAVCLVAPWPRLVLAIVAWVSAAETLLGLETARRVLAAGPLRAAHTWLYADAFSAFHLVVLGLVYTGSSIFAGLYFRRERGRHRFTARVARRFGPLWLAALAAMALVLVSNNLGVMWVGVESTTLVTAFLISLHTDRQSLEAMWKYLIICSVGIAFAFMGTLLAAAAVEDAGLMRASGLLWTDLVDPATHLDPMLMKIAFAFLIVGYGTKAGLAPVHSWLPDAHSQAPAPVSAMFSGFLLNAALYCIVRYVPLVTRALGDHFASGLLVIFGILSVLLAAVFIVFQTDVKRLLAYHSVEHLGIIALGYGLGPIGAFAALFHTLNHSLCKSLAFFAAGRLGQEFGSHDMHTIGGALRVDRLWGLALVGSLLALIGVAPFAIFMSEYQLLRAAVSMHAWIALTLFLVGGGIVFISALRHLIDMVYGSPRAAAVACGDGPGAVGVVGVSLGLLLLLGVWLPGPVRDLMQQAAAVVSAGTG